MRFELIPSILSADHGRLADEVRAAAAAGIGKVQVDVMDGRFVPNLTVGLPVVRDLARAVPEVVLDVHLMVSQPERFLDAFADAGAGVLTIHVESTPHAHRAVQQIRAKGVKAGAAICPATPLAMLEALLPDLDVALVMTVNPGFGGQAFIPGMLDKVRRLRQMLDSAGYRAAIQVDGGINPTTAGDAVAAGATQLVAGSAVFGSGVPVAEAVAQLRAAAEAGWARRAG
jgi:ribulose-phosphate 3-epimerase